SRERGLAPVREERSWLSLAALDERLNARGGGDERGHHEDPDREQDGLQDVGAAVSEIEQNRERPAASKGGSEHLRADQDRGADDRNHARPDNLAGGCGGGF